MAKYHKVGTTQNMEMHDLSEPDHSHQQSAMDRGMSHEVSDRRIGARPESTAWQDSIGQILLACIMFLLPLALCAVLIYLVYSYIMPTDTSEDDLRTSYSITENNQTHGANNEYYYVAYSATRLVFISSLSSTLALTLIPVGMGLFSYRTAFSLRGASLRGDITALPSPYQFELCIRILSGGMMDAYQYVTYIVKRKTHRIPAVKALNEAALTLLGLLTIALAITIVDASLHIRTTTVRYNRSSPLNNRNFAPGRRLPADCLQQASNGITACNIIPGGSGAAIRLNGTAESFRVLGNVSDISSIVMADDGLTAILTVAKPPESSSFTAQSFASATTCETVTKRCNIQYTYGGCTACQSWTYNCQSAGAGLVLSGNLTSITNDAHMYQRFFADAAKTKSNSTWTPTSTIDGHIWWASLAYLTNAEITPTAYLGNKSDIAYDPALDLFATTYGTIYGLISCNTTLFDATYDMDSNGSISNIKLTNMNDTAGRPFVQPLIRNFGNANLETGLNTASVSSNTSQQLAYGFARVMDRTLLGLAAGYLDDKQPLSASQISSRQVARVPKPDFWALLGLNMLLTVIGVTFTLAVIFLRMKQGVTNVQARLDTGALVAALFESREVRRTATSVEDSFAELRGIPTSRIMISDQNDGKDGGFVVLAPRQIG